MDRPKILIVEDNEAFIIIISAVLKDYVLIVVSSAEAAIHSLETHDIDLVITDYEYGGGGFPVLRPHLIKNKKKYIIQSSITRNDSGPYLVKSINKAELVTELNRAVNYSLSLQI